MPYPDAKYPFDQRLAGAAADLLVACKQLLYTGNGRRYACYCFDPDATSVPCDNCVAAEAISKAEGEVQECSDDSESG